MHHTLAVVTAALLCLSVHATAQDPSPSPQQSQEAGPSATTWKLEGTWIAGLPQATASVACDWSDVAWIGDGKRLPSNDEGFYAEDPAPQFRKNFATERKVQSALLHIAGLGFYEAQLNGQPLSDNSLAPLWTPYGHRVLYDTYDVTNSLVRGENVLAVTLGNGWYNPLPLRMWGRFNLREALTVGRPCLVAKLEIRYEDGSADTVVSDTSWKVADGPLLRNSVYLGEVYDARRETPGWQRAGFDDATWRQAVRVEGPGGVLQPRVAPPVGVRATWQAVAVSTPRAGVHVVDLGRNFAGQARFRLGAGDAGTAVTFRYGELLHPDGTVNGLTGVCGQIKRAGMGGPGAPDVAEQTDVYIRRGSGDETYTPQFTWHGFRYVQIEGLTAPPATSDVTALALASAVPDACEFECSNVLFNDLHRVCRQTFLSNLFGVQSDCPRASGSGTGPISRPPPKPSSSTSTCGHSMPRRCRISPTRRRMAGSPRPRRTSALQTAGSAVVPARSAGRWVSP